MAAVDTGTDRQAAEVTRWGAVQRGALVAAVMAAGVVAAGCEFSPRSESGFKPTRVSPLKRGDNQVTDRSVGFAGTKKAQDDFRFFYFPLLMQGDWAAQLDINALDQQHLPGPNARGGVQFAIPDTDQFFSAVVTWNPQGLQTFAASNAGAGGQFVQAPDAPGTQLRIEKVGSSLSFHGRPLDSDDPFVELESFAVNPSVTLLASFGAFGLGPRECIGFRGFSWEDLDGPPSDLDFEEFVYTTFMLATLQVVEATQRLNAAATPQEFSEAAIEFAAAAAQFRTVVDLITELEESLPSKRKGGSPFAKGRKEAGKLGKTCQKIADLIEKKGDKSKKKAFKLLGGKMLRSAYKAADNLIPDSHRDALPQDARFKR